MRYVFTAVSANSCLVSSIQDDAPGIGGAPSRVCDQTMKAVDPGAYSHRKTVVARICVEGDPDVTLVQVAKEEEVIGIAAGAYFADIRFVE